MQIGRESRRKVRAFYPDGELVGLGHGLAFAGVDDAVLADGHGIALDVLGDALGVARLQFEPDRSACGQEGRQDQKRERMRSDHHCDRGWGRRRGSRWTMVRSVSSLRRLSRNKSQKVLFWSLGLCFEAWKNKRTLMRFYEVLTPGKVTWHRESTACLIWATWWGMICYRTQVGSFSPFSADEAAWHHEPSHLGVTSLARADTRAIRISACGVCMHEQLQCTC